MKNTLTAKSQTPENIGGTVAIKYERLAHIVRQVVRDFQVCLESQLQPHGVNHGYWSYLRELWSEEGLSQRELSERVGLSEPTTNSVVKRMEAAGLLELRPIVEGKPRRLVYLTPKGRSLQSVLVPKAEVINLLAVEGISEEKVAILRECLLTVHNNLATLQSGEADIVN
ncbi:MULTISPECIES: MarR family winged helix-turn-helix transcriptional regulator [Marinomonas]|uniref:DNA-binding transcriptional regulator, MarR family n=3 Tax=Marinomonas TaxID=28253 RepID=A0A1M5N493_9GAMM|nr:MULTISPECIES: winged helix-turn-helix transcriptional regulator [Marinomonas]MBR7890159.1 winged helix-turn-helix transcriptional regulator [Marinomonas vulgaris]RCW94935.1 DNA-binding MarR family transcriptional regulator [Marinomonas foliarum]SHG83823.1 DNA-binding transcriptional regulator, MarR family [Marinomonas polaris DSM 16579]|tara:strand:+ start:1528 stop:2037 length:510 start_codon:yes stop_codon:yes gene_type:complete